MATTKSGNLLLFLSLVVGTLALVACSQGAKIGSFNIQVFGQTKMQNTFVANTLVKIISQFDLILIQEIRDSTNTSIYELVNMLNKANNNAYTLIVSMRTGSTNSKEQYAYIYKVKTTSLRIPQFFF